LLQAYPIRTQNAILPQPFCELSKGGKSSISRPRLRKKNSYLYDKTITNQVFCAKTLTMRLLEE
jgi:hypothetical protein